MPCCYRIFFHDAVGDIVGRQDFEAEDDGMALTIATLLFDACSDVSHNFELWESTRLVNESYFARAQAIGRQLSTQRQAAVARTEEQLRDSQWAVASSKRLLEQLRHMTDGGGRGSEHRRR